MPWVGICERLRTGCGRDVNKTYVNVISSVRRLNVDAAAFVAQNPAHPWADPVFNEFIVDISDQLGESAHASQGVLFHSHFGNGPIWQNETAGSGAPLAAGSFADPEDDQSAFTADAQLPDDRWIVRLYDDDPATTGQHFASLALDEGQSAGQFTVYLKLFNADDTPSNTGVQNAKTDIAGRLFIFDFTAGVTDFFIKTDKAGVVVFPSNHRYRHVGPADEPQSVIRVYGRSMSPVE